MDYLSADRLRISGRLKNALVADLVMDDLGPNGDHWLVEPMSDEQEWTGHLARQLGLQHAETVVGIHDTLLQILPEIDDLLKLWPIQHDAAVCRRLAEEATKHLSPVEIYGTLLAGQTSWRRLKVQDDCRIDRLRDQLQPMLERALAAELHRVFDNWVKWDIPRLKERRQKAIAAAKRAESNEGRSRQRAGSERSSGRERPDRLMKPYQPPGRI